MYVYPNKLGILSPHEGGLCGLTICMGLQQFHEATLEALSTIYDYMYKWINAIYSTLAFLSESGSIDNFDITLNYERR